MGRNVDEMRINEKADGVKSKSRSSINGAANVAVKSSPEKPGKNGHIHENHILKGTSTNEEKISNHELVDEAIEADVRHLSEMTLSSTVEPASKFAANGANGKPIYSPDQEKKLELNFQVTANKQQRYHVIKSHYDEDDNWSLDSSATSVHTKVTVPVAPKFTCVDRLERRKEFYTKLEEKHRALEKEKHDYEARIKEEEDAAIKLLRKNMSYKANPVPSFYREGSPPKVELKKLPVTRAKSPNFTRRKNCGDAVTKATPEKLLSGRGTRRSLGEGKASSPMSSKGKAKNGSPTSNGSIKVRSRLPQIKERNKVSAREEGKTNADISAES